MLERKYRDSFERVSIKKGFWGKYLEIVRTQMLPISGSAE